MACECPGHWVIEDLEPNDDVEASLNPEEGTVVVMDRSND